MMNKYQKALRIITLNLEEYLPTISFEEELESMQELVDKTTPDKPVEKELRHGGIASMCPKCGFCLTNSMLPCDNFYKFCPDCGQKIDLDEEKED